MSDAVPTTGPMSLIRPRTLSSVVWLFLDVVVVIVPKLTRNMYQEVAPKVVKEEAKREEGV